jgi:hypothetical protein
MRSANQNAGGENASLVRLHLSFGWWTLLVFLTLGLVLESLHGFKVRWYLDVTNETRRLLWTLAHAHGTLLGLLNLAFAVSVAVLPPRSKRLARIASRALIGASVLMPGGFLLGGLVIYGGDPGLGILLLPLGAVLLFVGVLCAALQVRGKQAVSLDE